MIHNNCLHSLSLLVAAIGLSLSFLALLGGFSAPALAECSNAECVVAQPLRQGLPGRRLHGGSR